MEKFVRIAKFSEEGNFVILIQVNFQEAKTVCVMNVVLHLENMLDVIPFSLHHRAALCEY